MVAPVIVMLDERLDLGFEIARQEVVFQQDAVLQGLVPALDLTLHLRFHGQKKPHQFPGRAFIFSQIKFLELEAGTDAVAAWFQRKDVGIQTG